MVKNPEIKILIKRGLLNEIEGLFLEQRMRRESDTLASALASAGFKNPGHFLEALGEGEVATELESHLEAYRKSSGLAIYLSIMDNSGTIIAQAKDPEKTQAYISEVEQLVSNLVNTYPREGLKKAFYEDELGIVSTMRITDSWILVAISERNCPLGAISMSLSKLVAQIAEKAGDQGDGQKPGN